jgi:hypothetical protein
MHTVEMLQHAIQVARELGYRIHQDWLGGEGSGHCLVRGRKLLLLDLAQPPDEQFAAVRDALRGEIHLCRVSMSTELAESLDVRRVA